MNWILFEPHCGAYSQWESANKEEAQVHVHDLFLTVQLLEETPAVLLADGKTSFERRFGEPFKGPIIPFGAMVEYHPISAQDLSRRHQFGKKVLPGIFLGYELIAGRSLERRYSDCGFGRFGKVGRNRNLSSKN